MNNYLREKYSRFSDIELLGRVIGEREAKQYFDNGGTIQSLFTSSNSQLEMFTVFNEIFRRYLVAELIDGDFLKSPKIVTDYLLHHFAGQEHESFVAIYLTTQHRVIRVSELFRGTVHVTSVYPREVVKEALACNAKTVIFSHNHPSGTIEESVSDKNLTKHLSEALAIVDVNVLDHILIAGNQSMSFLEKGILF